MNQDYNGSNNYQSLNTTNTEIQKQVGEKAKRKGAKLLKKQGGKIAKPLLKKLASAFKIVFVKVLKLLLTK